MSSYNSLVLLALITLFAFEIGLVIPIATVVVAGVLGALAAWASFWDWSRSWSRLMNTAQVR